MRKQKKLGEIARRYSDSLTAADVLTDGVCCMLTFSSVVAERFEACQHCDTA